MRELLPIVLTSITFAKPVLLTLDQVTGENLITIKATVASSFSDTKTTSYSGSIEADIPLDGNDVTTFQMTVGKITATNVTFLFESPGIFSQTATFDRLAATPVSPNGPEILTTPGQFNAPQHYFLLNEGCTILAGTFGDSKSDVLTAPFAAFGDHLGTITSGTPSEIRSSLTSQIIATSRNINLVLPLDSTVINEDTTLVTKTTGTVTASGLLLEYTHPFFEWAADDTTARLANPGKGDDLEHLRRFRAGLGDITVLRSRHAAAKLSFQLHLGKGRPIKRAAVDAVREILLSAVGGASSLTTCPIGPFARHYLDEVRKVGPWPSPGATLQQVNRHLSEALEMLERAVSESDLIRRDRDDPPQLMVERFEVAQRRQIGLHHRGNAVGQQFPRPTPPLP